MSEKTHKRRRYFLLGSSQPRMIIIMQLVFALVAILVSVMLYVIADKNLTENYFSAQLAIENVRQILLPTLIAVNIIGLVISVVIFIFVSHRVAGPIHQVRNVFHQVKQGDLRPIVKFRSGDFLKPLDKDINLVMDFFASEMDEVKEKVDVMSQILNGLGESQDILEDPTGYERMRATVAALKKTTGKFETDREK